MDNRNRIDHCLAAIACKYAITDLQLDAQNGVGLRLADGSALYGQCIPADGLFYLYAAIAPLPRPCPPALLETLCGWNLLEAQTQGSVIAICDALQAITLQLALPAADLDPQRLEAHLDDYLQTRQHLARRVAGVLHAPLPSGDRRHDIVLV